MVILITGASGGIGKATVDEFIKHGHEVHGIDIADFGDCGGAYTHHIADVCDPETFPEGIEPEVVINCAGVQDSGRDIEVNLMGAINITEKYAIDNPNIVSVVNVGSASAHTGSEFPEYAASKGGLATYTNL